MLIQYIIYLYIVQDWVVSRGRELWSIVRFCRCNSRLIYCGNYV